MIQRRSCEFSCKIAKGFGNSFDNEFKWRPVAILRSAKQIPLHKLNIFKWDRTKTISILERDDGQKGNCKARERLTRYHAICIFRFDSFLPGRILGKYFSLALLMMQNVTRGPSRVSFDRFGFCSIVQCPRDNEDQRNLLKVFSCISA